VKDKILNDLEIGEIILKLLLLALIKKYDATKNKSGAITAIDVRKIIFLCTQNILR